jgi:MFS transporter, DHA2 family, lincomycin resistance protein
MLLMLSISAIMMPAQTNALNELPKNLYPHGTAIANTLQPVSGALGVSVFVSIMTQSRESYLDHHTGTVSGDVLNDAMTYGVHHAYWFALGLAVMAVTISLFIKKAAAPDVEDAVGE